MCSQFLGGKLKGVATNIIVLMLDGHTLFDAYVRPDGQAMHDVPDEDLFNAHVRPDGQAILFNACFMLTYPISWIKATL